MPTLLNITITSLGGLGDGIGDYEGKPVFVPKSLPGDQLSVRILHENKDGLRGEIHEIIAPSPERVNAACPHFNHCGGCSLQQLAPESYRQFKQRILANALRHADSDIAAEIRFLPPATRRRTEWKILRHDGRVQLAYHGLRSHNLVPIHTCLILTPALAQLIDSLPGYLTALPGITAISATEADSGLDVLLHGPLSRPQQAHALTMADALNITRLSFSDKNDMHILIPGRVSMRFDSIGIALPPNAFLQASKEAQALLTQAVLQGMEGMTRIADLFCGIGTYAIPLAKQAQVLAVEGDKDMTNALQDAITRHAITTLRTEQRDLFTRPLMAKELNAFDGVVINPPRAGAFAQTQQLAQSSTQRIVMVSCNPATFARDAKLLLASGFRLTHVLGVDQFVWSPHLEVVAVFVR